MADRTRNDGRAGNSIREAFGNIAHAPASESICAAHLTKFFSGRKGSSEFTLTETTTTSQPMVLAILADSTLLVGSMAGGSFDPEQAMTTAQQILEMLAQGIAERLLPE